MLGCTGSGYKEASAGSWRRRETAAAAVAALAVGDGPRTILRVSASPSIVPESLQMTPRGGLKRRGAFRPSAGLVTEARTASWGSIQRLSSPEKMPGCSSREARLSLSSRRPASVINASANFVVFFFSFLSAYVRRLVTARRH